MSLPTSGRLTLEDLRAQFPLTPEPVALAISDFYAGGDRVPAGTLRNFPNNTDGRGQNAEIPSAGALRLFDFYGAPFTAGLRSYYQFNMSDNFIQIPNWKPQLGDWSITFNLIPSSLGSAQSLLSCSHDFDCIFLEQYGADGLKANILIGEVEGESIITTGNLTDGVDAEIELRFVSSTNQLELHVDSNLVGSATYANLTGTQRVNLLGSSQDSTKLLGGVMYNVVMTDGVDNRSYPIDDTFANNPSIRDELATETNNYQFQGTVDDSYVAITPLQMGAGGSIEFNMIWERTNINESYQVAIGLNGNSGVGVNVSGYIFIGSAVRADVEVYVNDDPDPKSNLSYRLNPNEQYRIRLNFVRNRSFTCIGSYGNGGSFYFSGRVWDVMATSTSEASRYYPLDDGWSNNPVIRNTLDSSTDGVATNFVETQWSLRQETEGYANNFVEENWFE